MNFNLLSAFFHVAIEQSFIKASKTLGVSQPAISASIKKLEKELRSVLLERTNRGIIMTESGKKLFDHCKKVFEILDLAKGEFLHDNEAISGPLKIGTSDEIASYLLAEKLDIIKEEFPNVSPEVFIAPGHVLLEKLKEGELDLLLLFYTPPIPEGLYEQELYDVRFKGVVKQEHRRDRSILTRLIADKVSFAAHKKKFDSIKKHFEDYADAGIWLSTNNTNMSLQLAFQGKGVAFLPDFMVDPLISTKKLVCLNPRIRDYYSLKIVMRNSFVPNKSYKRLIGILQEQ